MPMSAPSSTPSTPGRISRRRLLGGMLGVPLIAGCKQMAVVGRIFYGDPKQEGFFKQVTGESLEKGARVAVVCTAPDVVTTEYDMVSIDVQEQLIRTMRRRGINVVDPGKVSTALDENGGYFDLRAIVDAVETDYLFHIDIEFFSHLPVNSPRLYHGRASGNVYGYKILQPDGETSLKQAVRVFEREFNTEYPGKHPIPADQTPERVFRNRFIDHLCTELGRMFYDFRTNETFR